MNLSLQDKPRSNQMADSRLPTAVISHFYSAVYMVADLLDENPRKRRILRTLHRLYLASSL